MSEFDAQHRAYNAYHAQQRANAAENNANATPLKASLGFVERSAVTEARDRLARDTEGDDDDRIIIARLLAIIERLSVTERRIP